MINKLLKIVFILFFVKPLVYVCLGLNIIGKSHLPKRGPAIIAANHNSHLDTLVLMAIMPISMIFKVRPIAAADYFLKNKLLSWFSLNIISIIPMKRKISMHEKEDIFEKCKQALADKQILIIFPEGSRGDPENLSQLKQGIYHLYKATDGVPVYPVLMRGLGKSLPKGSFRFVPFNCDIVIDKALPHFDNKNDFMHALEMRYALLEKKCLTQI